MIWSRTREQTGRLMLFSLLSISMAMLGACSAPTDRGQVDIGFAVSPSGEEIVFNAAGEGKRDLYRLLLPGGEVKPVTSTPTYEYSPSYSPNGQTIVYAAARKLTESFHLYTCGLDGAGRKQITHDDSVADMKPTFSADGTRIVFARAYRRRPYSMGGWVWDNWDVCIVNADGSGFRRITHNKYYHLGSPALSPRGGTILFGAETLDDRSGIYVVNESGATPPRRLTGADHGSWPRWSPNGQQILFTSDRAHQYHYTPWIMQRDGSRPAKISDTECTQTAFTADGKQILFLHQTRHSGAPPIEYDLLEMDRDGRNLHLIADSSLFNDPLNWKRPQPSAAL